MTFHVAVVAEGNPGIGRIIRSFGSYPAAKRYAEEHATDYRWGLVIVDDVRSIADWGTDFTSATDCEQSVAPPFYAHRSA